MTTDNDDAKKALANMKKEMAKKKPKLAVPTEFLDNAKSYDDKLTLVKILSEKEKSRVVLMFKKMIQSGIAESNRKKGLK
jgi:ribonuclease D